MTFFQVGDAVRARYMSDETIEGVVLAVDGDDVTVQYEWDKIVHHGPAVQLLSTVESRFIPDEKFAREVRRSRMDTRYTLCTAASTVRVRGGVSDRNMLGAEVTVWRWQSAGDRPDQRQVAALARDAVAASRGPRREKLSRQSVEVFRSEHAGVASRTTYRVVAA